jgi:hypothetical protein
MTAAIDNLYKKKSLLIEISFSIRSQNKTPKQLRMINLKILKKNFYFFSSSSFMQVALQIESNADREIEKCFF